MPYPVYQKQEKSAPLNPLLASIDKIPLDEEAIIAGKRTEYFKSALEYGFRQALEGEEVNMSEVFGTVAKSVREQRISHYVLLAEILWPWALWLAGEDVVVKKGREIEALNNINDEYKMPWHPFANVNGQPWDLSGEPIEKNEDAVSLNLRLWYETIFEAGLSKYRSFRMITCFTHIAWRWYQEGATIKQMTHIFIKAALIDLLASHHRWVSNTKNAEYITWLEVSVIGNLDSVAEQRRFLEDLLEKKMMANKTRSPIKILEMAADEGLISMPTRGVMLVDINTLGGAVPDKNGRSIDYVSTMEEALHLPYVMANDLGAWLADLNYAISHDQLEKARYLIKIGEDILDGALYLPNDSSFQFQPERQSQIENEPEADQIVKQQYSNKWESDADLPGSF